MKRAILISVFIYCSMAGCAAIQQFTALGKVDFSLDGVSGLRMAGVNMANVNSYKDFGLLDVTRIARAFSQKSLPVEFLVHVRAENPASNNVSARLVGLEWTLFLEDKQTVSGRLDPNLLLEPGKPQDIPVTMAFDLIEFFDGNVKDLTQLALSFAGKGGEPKKISLKATPTIETPLGPIRYPQPLTIVDRRIGG
ncbi:MAG: hypothetical protein HOH43_19945 [Candidatus Latescibacteria bacterium]|nr:hypothetical protein [Candidatus Latescibacterota bacterium]